VRLLLDLKARILTVLDSKGLALLAFDGIVVAATTFAAEKGGVFHRRGMARWPILIIILALAASALFLCFVLRSIGLISLLMKHTSGMGRLIESQLLRRA
jgi:hypothetical protein